MVKMVQVSNVIKDLDQFDYEILFQINKWKELVKVLNHYEVCKIWWDMAIQFSLFLSMS